MRALSFLTVCVCLFLVSCGSTEEGLESPESLSVLRFPVGDDPETLDPHRAFSTITQSLCRMLYEGLTRMDPDGSIHNALASSVTVSKDKTQYTFVLKESVWSNGDPVTAYDFEKGWKRALSPDFDSQPATTLYVIQNARAAKSGKVPLDAVGVHAVDEKTLVVTLERTMPYFLELCSLPIFFPSHDDDAYNGPFILRSWEHDAELVFEKNTMYWDATQVHLDQVVMPVVADANTALMLYEMGEVDCIGEPMNIVPVDALDSLQMSQQLRSVPIAASYLYAFNTEVPPLNNRKFRQALALALDCEETVTHVLHGDQIPATQFLPPMLALGTPHQSHTADHVRAQRLFSEAMEELALKPSSLKPLVLVNTMSDRGRRLAEAAQAQWLAVLGLRVDIENYSWTVYLDKRQRHDYQICPIYWACDYSDATALLEIFDEDYGLRLMPWHDAEYSALIEQARRERDPHARKTYLRLAHERLLYEAPATPLYHSRLSSLAKDYVHGIYFSPLGHVDLRWVRMKDEG